MIFLTSIFFSVSFGPVSWVLASEVSYENLLYAWTLKCVKQVFPTNTRAIGTSAATCANWVSQAKFAVMVIADSAIGIQHVDWPSITISDDKDQMEILPRIHRLEFCRFHNHHPLLPRDQR